MKAEETEGSKEVKAVFLAEINYIIFLPFCNKSKFSKTLIKGIPLNMSDEKSSLDIKIRTEGAALLQT